MRHKKINVPALRGKISEYILAEVSLCEILYHIGELLFKLKGVIKMNNLQTLSLDSREVAKMLEKSINIY